MKKVTIVNLSTHQGGNGDHLADFIRIQLKSAEVEVIHFSKLTNLHGCGRCQYDCFKKAENCPYYEDDIIKAYRLIASSDFCYMILPNYSDVPPTGYFMFRERSQCIWQEGLFRKYALVPKHFLVFSNTSHHFFEELLVNEIASGQKLSIDFLASSDIKAKGTDGHLMSHAYFQDKVLEILKSDYLI